MLPSDFDIEALYREYQKDLFAYLLSLTNEPHAAEDLLQETFVRALLSIRSFRGDSTVKTWLCGIARNLWRQSLRRQRRECSTEDVLLSQMVESFRPACRHEAGVDDGLVQREMSRRVLDLMEERDGRSREVMRLRLRGYSYAYIAQTLQISESSARVIEHRTRKWLRSQLAREGLL